LTQDSNPAASPTPCQDIQGDGRWMSLHNRFVSDSKGKEPDVLFVGDSLVQLLHEFEGLLPRGKSPNPLRERNASVNALVQAEVASLSHVSFLDVDPGFIHSDGSIAHQDMYDYLHLTPQAYQRVCQPLHERIKSLLDKHAP
uniref:SGNH hydrolase-type esterase domain-containing protein n=1 Tax=Sinocyclocheilus grahami TaxID=75366 RepID=A0A672MX10_SINGR